MRKELPHQNDENSGKADQGTDGSCPIAFFMFKHASSIAQPTGAQKQKSPPPAVTGSGLGREGQCYFGSR